MTFKGQGLVLRARGSWLGIIGGMFRVQGVRDGVKI
jgi:hypothetical protein